MCAKRSASNQLTQDNWQEEDSVEETTEFKMASEEELKHRQIKKARRRGTDCGGTVENTASVFKGFTGFAYSEFSNKPSFSFLNKTDSTTKPTTTSFASFNFSSGNTFTKNQEGDKTTAASTLFGTQISPVNSITNNAETSKKEEQKSINGSLTNDKKTNAHNSSNSGLSKLKSLNESVLKWMQANIEKNPYVDLTPIFMDYKNHLEKVKSCINSKSNNESRTTDTTDGSVMEKSIQKEATTSVSYTLSSPIAVPPVSFESKEAAEIPKFSFGDKDQAQNKGNSAPKFSFNLDKPVTEMTSSSKFQHNFSFGSKDNSGGGKFTFGNGRGSDLQSKGFSFGVKEGGATPFTFGASASDKKGSGESTENEDTEEVPKVEVTEVKEQDAIYEKRVKLFYKKEDSYVERGIGTLFLKPAEKKTQLIIRAMTNLGNILLNIVLNESILTQRVGKNNVLIICVANPPVDPKADPNTPTSMLIRVRTADDADDLLQKINMHKKSL